MANKKINKNFAILGLGHFGMSVIQTLSEYDVDIMACDRDEAKLQFATDYATHVVRADVADEIALARLGLGNFDVIILAVGEDFEASQIATMIAKEQGAKYVIVKARNLRQKKILESIGANEVILPEHEIGAKLARRLASPNIMDILDDSEFYTITEMRPLDEWIGQTIQKSDIRHKHNITILAIRRGSSFVIPVSPTDVLTESDVLIVLSEKKQKQ